MISIRYKFLGILVGLVVVTMLAYLALAVRLFEADKEAYIYDSNASVVEALATETETLLASITRTLGSIADLTADQAIAANDRDRLVSVLFDGDSDLVDLVVAPIEGSKLGAPLIERSQAAFWELHDLDPRVRLDLRESLKSPIDALPAGKIHIQNAMLPGGIPLITVALRLPAAAGGADLGMVGQVRQDRLLKIFARPQMHTVFLIDGHGTVLAHPDVAVVAVRENVADPAFVAGILASPFKTGAKELQASDGEKWLTAYSKIDAGNLTVISKISRAAAFAATQRLVQKSMLFAGALILLALIVSMLFSQTLTTPLKRLFEATRRIAAGDFSVQVPPTSRDEVGALTTSFNAMAGKIVTLMGEVADKARMEKELETARLVQENLFPSGEAGDGTFDLAGFYTPASECGGDWWGHFRHGSRLYILIGDATGHGVPAALITAAAQSCCTTIQQMHKRMPERPLTPASIMSDLNAAIHHAAKGGMNMTFFIAMLDLETGKLVYTNASHEMPVIYGETDGEVTINMLMGDPDVCLGEGPASTYKEHVVDLKAGDAIVCYTDGLVESRNGEDKEWGERRFLKAIKTNSQLQPKALRDLLIGEAKAFAAGRPADDDITYIVVRWNGEKALRAAL